MQLRVEAYNLLNNANFALPDTNILNATFGRILSTQGSPRTIQVAMRILF
jgi:hypothetical protein